MEQLTLHLYDIKTKKDYSLLAKDYIDGSVEKNLWSNSQELQLGCFLGDSWALEAGYIPKMKFGSISHFRVDAGHIGTHGLPVDLNEIASHIPTAKVVREGKGSAWSVSALWYEGVPSDVWRLFLRIKYVEARAEGRGDLSFPCQIHGKKGDCLVGVRTWKSAHAIAPNLGATFRLGENLEGVVELPYYGPKFYGVAFGLRASFW